MTTARKTPGLLKLASSSLSTVTTVESRISDRSSGAVQDLVDAGREYTRQNLGRVIGFDSRALVERSPGKAPTAFRIWAAGTNKCDAGDLVFSERSAKAIIAEQTSRRRLYSFDFDHRSLMPGEDPTAGRAAGWHRLAIRQDDNGAPELWAVSCEWTPEARAGLEAETPEWRYFSPCYEVDPKTREVISYVNCAITNNPLTHGIPALASVTGKLARTTGGTSLALARHRVRELRVLSRRTEKASSRAAAGTDAKAEPPSVDELIAALEVLADPLPVPAERDRALDLIASHLYALRESRAKQTDGGSKMSAARAKVAAVQARFEKTEAASAARSARIQSGRPAYGDKSDPVGERIDTAIGNARRNRGETPAEIRKGASPHRPTQPSAPKDPVIEMIERAARNSRGGRP